MFYFSIFFEGLKTKLKEHEKNNSEKYYFQIRSEDRQNGFINRPIYERAARMIYLNKACFNGLYRVNSKGYFNVPFNKKDKIATFSEDNFDAIKDYFKNNHIHISNDDFEECVKSVAKDDFVYFDPPYDIFPDKQGFVDYAKHGFDRNG